MTTVASFRQVSPLVTRPFTFGIELAERTGLNYRDETVFPVMHSNRQSSWLNLR